MSRGRGRGGGGPGGGRGRGPAGTQRIAGVDITADAELLLAINDRPQPTPLYPEYRITLPKPLTKDERIQVARFRSLRERIHEGPLYTILGDTPRVGKIGEKSRTVAAGGTQFDPFEGMPTYSQRYTRKKRKIPKLDTRPYVLKFFPKELWSTLDPTQSTTNGVETTAKIKKLQISTARLTNGLGAYDRELSGEPKDPSGQLAANGNDDDDNDTGDQAMEDDVPPEEEDVDDDYASEEDEMGGDYNAEQYFDDGGDDAGDDYDAGEPDGDVY